MKEALTQEYLRYLENSRHRSLSTLESYQSDLQQYCDFISSNPEAIRSLGTSGLAGLLEVDLSTQITLAVSETAEAFCTYLKMKFYTPPTIARKCAAVEGFYKYLYKKGRSGKNPFSTIHFVKPKHSGRVCLEDSHVMQLLDLIPCHSWLGFRDRAVTALLYTTGIKIGELSRLTLADYSADEKILAVCKPGRKTRTISVPEWAAIILQNYLSVRRQETEGRCPGTDVLFLNRDGGPLTVRSIRRKLEQYSKEAKFSFVVTPEMLRRSHAVKMLQGGIPLQQLARQLGYFSAMALKQQIDFNDTALQPQNHEVYQVG
jgi:integrase/recombinase XerC